MKKRAHKSNRETLDQFVSELLSYGKQRLGYKLTLVQL